jgi:3-oxoacyl-(acyl-carrier-protein) synthase
MSGRAPEPAELPIVVTGAGVVTAAARGRAAFAAALAQTGDGPRPRTRQAGEGPRTRIEGFDVASLPEAKSLRRATPHALFGLAAAAEALAEAGGGVAPEESAVLVASTLGAANFSYRLWQELVKSGPLGASPMLFSEGVPNALVGHAARLLRLLAAGHMIGGGNGCGLRALAVARDLLECGRARRALVGASEEWSELAVRAYARFGIVAREGAPRRSARGLPMGEGAAMLCLERRDPERAAAPALATLRAVESVQLPSLRGAAAVDELVALFERTFAAARVRPSDVFLASAANGTAADRLEAQAVARLAASGAGAPRGVSRRVRDLCGETFSVAPLLQVVEALAVVAAGEPAAVLSLSPFASATLAVFTAPPPSERNG